MGVPRLHEKIQLLVDDGAIILAPQEGEDVLTIDRVTFKIDAQGINTKLIQYSSKSEFAYTINIV